MSTCNTAVRVVLRCAKNKNHTHTHVTHFGSTTGLPAPVFNPMDSSWDIAENCGENVINFLPMNK